MEAYTTSQMMIGGAFALASAWMWATASILFRRLGDNVSSLALNLGKGVVGLICLALTLAITGFGAPHLRSWLLLGLSGVIGIGIGDTLYFLTLMRLGARRTLVLTALIPLTTSALAMIFLGERLSLQGWFGGALTIGGVVWVMYERLPDDKAHSSWRGAIVIGLLTVLCEAVGLILSKVGLADTKPLDAAFIRLLAGTAALVFYGLARREIGAWVAPLKVPRRLGVLVVASVIGTYLGIWFALAALYYTSATMATILNSTSPIFVLPLAYFALHEKITLRAVFGAVVAVVGVALLFAS